MQWFTAVGLAVMLAAPGSKEAPKKAEPPSIVGEWVCTKCVADGKEFPEEALTSIKMEFTAAGKYQGQFGPDQSKGTFTTDPTKDPAQIDFASDKTGKGNKGIFKADKHGLTLCFAEDGRERPTKFESAAGTRTLLLTFTRVEKKKD
jgi:uncharacterized protein (TIGR03067 family)